MATRKRTMARRRKVRGGFTTANVTKNPTTPTSKNRKKAKGYRSRNTKKSR